MGGSHGCHPAPGRNAIGYHSAGVFAMTANARPFVPLFSRLVFKGNVKLHPLALLDVELMSLGQTALEMLRRLLLLPSVGAM